MILMKHIFEKNDAVSPVVGVMLMLVVTIIIAAVVAAFAGGLATNQEPAANTVIKLDNYKMGTIIYTGYGPYTYTADSFEYGFNETKAKGDPGYTWYGAFGLYNMTFAHNGGDSLKTKDVTLAITTNAATFEMPLSEVYNSTTISAGDKVAVSLGDISGLTNGRLFGLGQQDMYMGGYGSPEFSWSLKDGGNNVIAKGSIIEPWWEKETA